MKKWLSLSLIAALLLPLLTACAGPENETPSGEEGLALRVCAAAGQRSADPLEAVQAGGDTLLFHLYENLMRWEDDGTGHAVLVPGAAESVATEESYDGSVTYTFTLRRDAKWSDGKALTAKHFLYTWRRLFELEDTPAVVSKLYMVEGYFDAKREKNGALLTGVSAPDQYTFVITLTGHYAYFLDEFCAGGLTMPVREDMVKKYGGAWGQNAEAVITNGPYQLSSMSGGEVTVERNRYYHSPKAEGPETITFVPLESAQRDGGELAYSQVESGELNFLAGLPQSVVSLRSGEGTLEVEPVPATCGLLMNGAAEPFDNEFVRKALAAVVDQEALTAAMGDPTLSAATGFVPWGISNRDNEWSVAEPVQQEPAVVLPEDLINGAQAEQPEETFWDYRAVGDYGSTKAGEDRETQVAGAKLLMSQGGYPNGENFPEVELLYVDTPQNEAAAKYLQNVWKTTLNVAVTPRGLSETEARELLLSGEYTMAVFRFDAAFDDALAFLHRWQGKFGPKDGNLVSYADRAYDLLLSVVSASSDSAREACLHDAEELLLSAKSVVPLFYYGTTSALSEELTGVYRKAGGAYFFDGVRLVEEESE